MRHGRRSSVAVSRDPQILHHPMISMKHDVAVDDEIAGEALIPCAE
jgi:hypothetical protein